MRRRNRDINIFSISALDLFASAMGVFVLLTIILFPYYMKQHTVVQQMQRLKQELQTAQQKLRQAEGDAGGAETDIKRARAEARRARAEAKAAQAEARAAREKLAAAQSLAEAAKKEAEALRKGNTRLRKQKRSSRVFALLGITTNAKSFVILVDMSSSMMAYSRVMARTMQRLLDPLGAETKVQIIGFNAPNNRAQLYAWRSPFNLSPMTASNKRQAMAFARALSRRFSGRTPTHRALREALRYSAEAIILLSDGAPTDSKVDIIIQDITRANAGKKEINTVAIGDFNKHPALVRFLQALAKRNRGEFTGVAGG